MLYTRRAKSIILEFLQDAFSQPDLVDGGNDFLWSQNEEESKILIADQHTENLEVVGRKPAIIISRGPVSFMNIGLNQMERMNMRTGTTQHQDNLKTSVRVNCFSRNGLQAETLAVMVLSLIQFFAEGIRKKGEVFEINALSIGQESLIESDSQIEMTVVPVEVGLYIYDRWVFSDTGGVKTARHDATGIRIHTDDKNIDREIKT